MSIDFENVALLLKNTILRKLGDEVDLIFRYGSRVKGTAHAYSDLDISYTPVHESTWDSITLSVNDVLCDLYPIHWSKLEQMANFEDISTTVLIDNQIVYARCEESVSRFHTLQKRLHELCKPEARPVMVRKALENFQATGYPFYLLCEAAHDDHLLTCLQQSQTILRTVLHCVAIVNQAPIDTRKLSEVLALPRLPDDFFRNVVHLIQAKISEEVLSSTETLLRTTRTLLLSEQGNYVRHETGYKDVFDSAYPELKNDLEHVILSAERRDLFNIPVISLYQELMVHMAEAESGVQFTSFNSLADYEQDLGQIGFPNLLSPILERDFAQLKRDCADFDEKMKEFLLEKGVPLHSFHSMWDLEKYLKSIGSPKSN